MGNSYKLTGGTNLAAHVGHQIEVTGTIAPSSGATTGTSSGTSTPSTTGTSSSASGMSHAAQTLNVSSVRMISASCPAQ
jgi:hypothetical protein